MFRSLFEELGESGFAAALQPVPRALSTPGPQTPLPPLAAPVQPFAATAAAPKPAYKIPALAPVPVPEPARPRMTRTTQPWNPNPTDTITAALSVPAPRNGPRNGHRSRSKPRNDPHHNHLPVIAPPAPRRQLPYIPTIEVFVFYYPDSGTASQPILWLRTVINHTRNLRDILTLTDSLMGGRGHIEILFFGLIQAEGSTPRTFTFSPDNGLAITLNGEPVESQKPITLHVDGTQVMAVRWSQRANNNYRMELAASPHPIPTTWITATQEPNAPFLIFTVFDRARKGPRGGMLPRAALFEEFRHPELFGLTYRSVRVVQKTFPLVPSRSRFLSLTGTGSGVSSVATISPTSWNTITVMFWADEFPRATPEDCVHRFFSQDPFVFGIEYCVAGAAGLGAKEGVYLRGEMAGQGPVYARTPLQKATWYIFVAAYRGNDLSFGAYPVRASTQEERLAITIERGVLRDVTSVFHSMSYGGPMHIGYGFRGLVARIHYFDKYAAFEDALEQEFTDSFLSDWYR